MKRFLRTLQNHARCIGYCHACFLSLCYGWVIFRNWQTILLSLVTAFAAYTAIYTLNDLVGVTGDKEKFIGGINPGYSVEASEMRYPLAQNLLSYRSGWLWFAVWFASWRWSVQRCSIQKL